MGCPRPNLTNDDISTNTFPSSGFVVVTTASLANFDLVESKGADAVFDYHDPQCAHKIKEYTKGSLRHALDCVSTEASYNIVAQAMPERSEAPMRVVTLRLADTWPRPDIQATPILAYTTFGEAFTKFGMDIPAMPSHYEFGVMFWKLASELIAARRVVPHPFQLREGGLGGIPRG